LVWRNILKIEGQNFIFVEENKEVYNKILKICLFHWVNELHPDGNFVFYHRSHFGAEVLK